MGFMDSVKAYAGKLGDTVEKGAKTVSDNSKKMAEKSRVKKEITQTENEINAAYLEIGRKYFEKIADNAPDEYAEEVETIKKKKARAEQLKGVLFSLEDKTTCVNCGAELLKTQRFCDKCGAKVELPTEPVIAAEEVFSPAAPVVEDTASESISLEKPETPARKCPNCGEAISDGDSFCETCGAKIDTE